MTRDSHGNASRNQPRRLDSERWPKLSIRKVPADSVPYGDSISRNGRTVWAAYDDGRLVAVGATRDEVRSKLLITQHIPGDAASDNP